MSEYQLGLLKDIFTELNKSIITFLFMVCLPYITGKKYGFILKSYKSEVLMMTHLNISIEHDLKNAFEKYI